MSKPVEFNFLPYQFPKQQKLGVNVIQQVEPQVFKPQQRQSLKNAFRYICRLIFKEASCNSKLLINIARNQKLYKEENQQEQPPLYLFDCAEQISGQRYFSKHLLNFSKAERNTICRYMIWFLQVKYLRHIHEQGKGKRKKMRKDLYIKFKNQVMIPYLLGIIEQGQE